MECPTALCSVSGATMHDLTDILRGHSEISQALGMNTVVIRQENQVGCGLSCQLLARGANTIEAFLDHFLIGGKGEANMILRAERSLLARMRRDGVPAGTLRSRSSLPHPWIRQRWLCLQRHRRLHPD